MRKLVNNQLPPILEAFVQRCSVRKLLLKISQNSPMGIELLIHNSLLNIEKHPSLFLFKIQFVLFRFICSILDIWCIFNFCICKFWYSAFFRNIYIIRPQACNFIKKEILAQVFSCEFCEISKNTFSYRILPVAASGDRKEADN